MEEHLPAVLLMGGGEGMGPIEATARALGDALYDENLGEPIGQVLVICGRNKKLVDKLRAIIWKVPVQVFFIPCEVKFQAQHLYPFSFIFLPICSLSI